MTDYLAVKIKVQPVFVVQLNLLIMRITEYLHLHLSSFSVWEVNACVKETVEQVPEVPLASV